MQEKFSCIPPFLFFCWLNLTFSVCVCPPLLSLSISFYIYIESAGTSKNARLKTVLEALEWKLRGVRTLRITLLRPRRPNHIHESSGGERTEPTKKSMAFFKNRSHGRLRRCRVCLFRDPMRSRAILSYLRELFNATYFTLIYEIPIPLSMLGAITVAVLCLRLPQPWRALAIWTEIVLLCVGSAAGDPHRRR